MDRFKNKKVSERQRVTESGRELEREREGEGERGLCVLTL